MRAITTKAGGGVEVAVCRDPEKATDDAQWDVLAVPTSGADDYVRSILNLDGPARASRSALAVRVRDDGTGPPPEVSLALVDVEQRPATRT